MKNQLCKAVRVLFLSMLIGITAQAGYTPVAVTGFTDDVIAEGIGSASGSTTIGVDGAGWDLVAQSFQATSTSPSPVAYLPNSGTINSVQTSGLSFQLANYTGNNGVRLALLNASQTLTFVSPIGGDIYLLGFAGDAATGGVNATITVTFTDNTTQVFTVNFADWYNGTGFAIQSIGRVNRNTNTLENPVGNPRLYEKLLTLSAANASKQIANINITKTTSTGVLNILAVSVNTICNPPTGLASSAVTTSSAGFSWNAVTGSAGYEYALTSSSTPPASGTPTSATTYNASGLSQGTNYCFHVRNSCGSSYSGWVTTCITTLCNVTAPTGLSATGITFNAANLGWTAVTGASGYEYAVTTSATPPASGTPISATTYAAGGLTPSTVYYLHVRAKCGTATYSSWTTYSFTTLAPPPCASPAPVNATNVTSVGADISWTAVSGASGYQYAVTTSATPPASGTNTTAVTYNSGGLMPSTVYYAHVRTDCGSSNYSTWVTISFTTLAPPPCTPPAPLIVTNITAASADLNWASLSGIAGYEYAVTTSATPPPSGNNIVSNSYAAGGLTPGTAYFAHVRTDCGGSNFSTWETTPFTTLPSCDAPVAAISNITDTTATINWNAVTNAQGYEYNISPGSAPPATGTGISATTYKATMLTRNTNYYLHLRTMCTGNNSQWATTPFKTTNVTSVGYLHKYGISLTVYPNPAKDMVTVSISGNGHPSGTVQLKDITGKLVSETNVHGERTDINLQQVPPGIYILKYNDDEGAAAIRILKE